MKLLALAFAFSSFVASAQEPMHTAGVLGTPAIQTFNDVTCQTLGDHVQTMLEPTGRFFRPFKTVNGNPTLTFTLPGGYKAVYTFGGTMTHVALRPDFCRVEISGAGPTSEAANKGNNDALSEIETFVLCRTLKNSSKGDGTESYRALTKLVEKFHDAATIDAAAIAKVCTGK
jgi:hypothetical protein